MADLIDLAVRNFKHCSNLGDLWRLLEPSELISGHGQVGAWGLIDIMAIDMDEFIIEASTMASSFARRCARLAFLLTRAARSSSVSPSHGGLSMLTLKIPPPQKGGKGGWTAAVSVTISVEPWDSKSGFSSRMVWRDPSGRRPICSILTVGES